MVKRKTKKKFNPCMVRDIFTRDGGRCIYCGDLAQEIDHVILEKDGGPAIRSNGVCTCRSCNQKKKNYFNEFITRAIFWLLEKGEDINWMDEFYKK